MLRRLVAAVALLASTAGCGLNPPLKLTAVPGGERPVELAEVPFHPQQAHHCGPASLLSLLEHSGVRTDYATLVERVYVPGLEGSLQVELQAAARGFGRIAYRLPPEPEAVLAEVAAGRPVLVLLNLGLPSAPVWHYAVVVGFEPRRNRIVLRSGRSARTEQRAPAWLRRWRWGGGWAIVALRPGEWPAAAERQRLLRALAAFEDASEPGPAGQAWAEAVERWPEEPVAWLGVGNAAYRGGDWAVAAAAYRRVLELDPERLPAQLNLAHALARQERPCDAVALLEGPSSWDGPLAAAVLQLRVELEGRCP